MAEREEVVLTLAGTHEDNDGDGSNTHKDHDDSVLKKDGENVMLMFNLSQATCCSLEREKQKFSLNHLQRTGELEVELELGLDQELNWEQERK